MLPQIFNGTLREHYVLLFGIAGGIAAVVGFVAAWIGAQFGARRAARMAAEDALARGGLGVDRNLTALVQAVDWLQCIALFPSYPEVIRFGSAVMAAGIDVFLLSAVDRRFGPYYAEFGSHFDGSADAIFSMVHPDERERRAR